MNTEILHIITEPTKIQILELLMQHNYCVRALSKKIGISEPAISQQLNILKKNGIISGKKMGYQIHYQINMELIKNAINELLSCLVNQETLPDVGADCSCEFASECTRYNNDRRKK
ncbi:MAG: metalloregulator ArsR/SmtB family transcription factor [Oscillospiraceae bacterium]|jgi:ArsR family transcriptional regulator|nr:DNA-binding transcriptional regulator, ArsR family [Ruminococcaceae bacterium BL-4]